VERLRLALLTPRFWPHVGECQWHALRLARGLVEQGHDVTVVAPAWRSAWPKEMYVGRVPLVRLRGSHRSGIGTLRWMYALDRWLKQNAGQFDAVLAMGLRHEAYVAIRALPAPGVPVVVQATSGDQAWQRTAAFGQRIARRCRMARAIIAPSQQMAGELADWGYSALRTTVIPPAVSVPPPRSPMMHGAARESLGLVNHDLITTDITPVALAVGRLDPEQRFSDLVRAWRIVTATRHDARLWIVGDGPERERLFRQIGDLDLRSRVLLPGWFDGLDQLVQAADLFVQPAACDAPPLALLEAMASGLPPIVADSPAAREAIEPEMTGVVVPPGDPKPLAAAISRLFDCPAEGVTLGSASRDAIKNRLTPEQAVQRLVEVLREA
jgi:glycosyltransferase involved in cell wall biosynthesis